MTTERRSAASARRVRAAAGEPQDEVRYRVLSPLTIAAWAMLIVLVAVGTAVWLLLAYTGGDAAANRVQLDAIRTAGTIVVGTGGAAALLLAARRQRSTEIALKQKDRDQADAARTHALQERVAEQTRQHQERVAAATEADAEARRVTDLYTKAADQLGSTKAPVRLAGLYALERLAQDHAEQRQTVVNLLCAYLRMPFTMPGGPPDSDADDSAIRTYQERMQEREVRLAAQRLFATHLYPGTDLSRRWTTFWADIDLDLTDATLIGLNLARCHIRTANFTRAHFLGAASFSTAWFAGLAKFTDAEFTGDALFTMARFVSDARFTMARFVGDSRFAGARFVGATSFGGTRFVRSASFDRARFEGDAGFGGAEFVGDARFDEAEFVGDVRFDDAEFAGGALFHKARFARGVPQEVARFWVAPVGEGNIEERAVDD